jgi:hypothetical protein
MTKNTSSEEPLSNFNLKINIDAFNIDFINLCTA